jgi:tRNA(fMet)-specific endonuclease VapC
VKPTLIDTDILSLFFRGNAGVVAQFQAYLVEHRTISFSIITYYEILSGLQYRDAQKQLTPFLEFAGQNSVLPLTEQTVAISANIYARHRKLGTPIDDIDILIAGVAIANNLVLATHDQRHCSRIEGLEI